MQQLQQPPPVVEALPPNIDEALPPNIDEDLPPSVTDNEEEEEEVDEVPVPWCSPDQMPSEV